MLNSLQKEMLEASISFLFDSIKDCGDSALGLSALNAISDDEVFNNNREKFERANILDAVELLRQILQHPNPQNRSTGSPYVGQEPGMAVWRDPVTKSIKKEPLGLLSLTTQQRPEDEPTTKADVVNFIGQVIERYKAELQPAPATSSTNESSTQASSSTDNPAPTGSFFASTAADFFQKAQDLMQQKDFAEAVKQLDEAIKKDPEQAEYYFQRAKALIRINRRADGLRDFNQAAHKRPQHAQTWVERGFTRENLGDIPGAIFDYDRALQLNPQQYFALSRRGCLRMQLGYVQPGEQDFVQALQLKPDDAGIYLWRGEQYMGLGRYTDALQDFNETLRLQPTWRDAQAMKIEAEKLCADPAIAQHEAVETSQPTNQTSTRCRVM